MAHQVSWNKRIVDEFIKEAMLSEDEQLILTTRVAGLSRQQQAIKLNMSLQSVDRITRKLKDKYDKVAKYDNLLPKRKLSLIEIKKARQ